MITNRWSLDHAKVAKPVSQLAGGFIPAKSPCPFAAECDTKKEGRCFHTGEHHPLPYACKLIDIRGNFRGSK